MKNNPFLNIFTFVLLALMFTGCSVIGDIFEAGLWVGVLLVILVIGIIFWVVKKLFR